MSHHHGYSIGDLEELPAYELDIYVDLLQEHIKKQEEEQEQQFRQQQQEMTL